MMTKSVRYLQAAETTYTCSECGFQTVFEGSADRHPGIHRAGEARWVGGAAFFFFGAEEDLRAYAIARVLGWTWQGPGWYGEELDGTAANLPFRLMSLEHYFIPALKRQMARLKPLLEDYQDLLGGPHGG